MHKFQASCSAVVLNINTCSAVHTQNMTYAVQLGNLTQESESTPTSNVMALHIACSLHLYYKELYQRITDAVTQVTFQFKSEDKRPKEHHHKA